MKPWLLSSCFVFVCGLTAGQHASAAHGTHAGHSQCFCCAQKACNLTVSTATEEIECFDVECKDICIPPVTFPWECRPKHCGRIRTVNVLTTEKRERQVCEYKWDVIAVCPRCRDALHAAGCDVAPGILILDSSTAAALPPRAPATAGTIGSAAPLSFNDELIE